MSNTFRYRNAYATFIIASLNVMIFLVVAAQGRSKALEIYRNVAVILPHDFGSIAWWKLPAANFFHLNLDHLAVNLLLLCLLGPFVEFALGVGKYVLTYLVSGVVAMFMLYVYAAIFDLYVPSLRVIEPQVTAGASACVLGILGARAAILLRTWANQGSRVARNHFLFVGFLILAQAALDLRMLSLSFGAHVTGAFVGFLLGLLLKGERLDLSTANPFSLAGAVKRT